VYNCRVVHVRREEVTMTEDIDIQAFVADAFRALADTLEILPQGQVDAPSLCAGWSVRNALAHMTMAARYSPDEFAAELRSVDFDFSRLSNRIAERDGTLPIDELLKNLRSDEMAQWIPPGGGLVGALSHVVIHGLDITMPLGLPQTASEEAMRLVLDTLTGGGVHQNFGTSIDGIQLCATDVDWSYGQGRRVAAPAQDIIVALCGRHIAGLSLADER
jgi:uncharacterized protein (TIGR03083 family)